MSEYQKPLPEPTPVSRPFWDAARDHRLVIPACRACDHAFFYPRAVCPRCLGDDIEWREATGKGVVYSFTILRQATTRGFDDEVPYAYALIELDEGVRLISNVIGCSADSVEIGMPVEVVFDDVAPDVTLPKFRPRAA